MIELRTMIQEAASYLEGNIRCKKHRVEHTGSLAYLLDLYDFLGETQKAKDHIEYLLGKIVESDGAYVFYPGHLDPMNMSQNVIDTGAAVDAIARFADHNRSAFSEAEHAHILEALRPVAESYLVRAAAEKPITNQRLWGLTGLASYAHYAREEEQYRPVARLSIERAFADMTPDGFFRYYPDAERHGSFAGYDGITAFYQSRHTAFIRYSLDALGMPHEPYKDLLRKSEQALLAMYTPAGVKDMRLECKRWYWLSSYEVASHSFDAFALARSSAPEASAVLHNALFSLREHFTGGYLHSHTGIDLDFQCPIFWTAHLAWLVRTPDIEESFNSASALRPFSFALFGEEVVAVVRADQRALVNARFSPRNPTVGIYRTGLQERVLWRARLPHLPPRWGLSLRETLNHAYAAARGGQVAEAAARLLLFGRESLCMLLPRYTSAYGKVVSLRYVQKSASATSISIEVHPASKYGEVLPQTEHFELRATLEGVELK